MNICILGSSYFVTAKVLVNKFADFLFIYCKESMYIVFEDREGNCPPPPTNLSKYLYKGKSEIEVNVNNSCEGA